MDLQQIVNRYADGLAAVDLSGAREKKDGTGSLVGVHELKEPRAVDEVCDWWSSTYPSDGKQATQVPYPGQLTATGRIGSRLKCDHVIGEGPEGKWEWALEIKKISLVGLNGKRNDFGTGKALSPFLKDRSLYHDVKRLRGEIDGLAEDPQLASRHAVIGFSFAYNEESSRKARHRFSDRESRLKIREIEKVCEVNGGALSVRPIVEFADGIFQVRQLVTGQYCRAEFDAWKHPCGGHGVVFGWEVRTGPDKRDLLEW